MRVTIISVHYFSVRHVRFTLDRMRIERVLFKLRIVGTFLVELEEN